MRPLLTFCLFCALSIAGCDDATGPGDPITGLPRPLTAAESRVVQGANVFGFDLLREVHARENAPNVVLSPLSASMALGMLLNGAAGQTWEETRTTLRLGGMSEEEANRAYRELIDLLTNLDRGVTFRIGNAVFAEQKYGLVPAFTTRVRSAFSAEVSALPFSAPSTLTTINEWVKQRTNGRIEKILDQLDPALAVLLLNAIYFQAEWTTQFDPKRTSPGSFRRSDGTHVDVPLMRMQDEEFAYVETARYRAAELPYGGGAYGMVVVVPEYRHSVGDIVASLNADAWNDLVNSLRPARISVVLPRFTVRYEELLNDALRSMGMQSAFRSADLSRMMPQVQCISFVLQKTFLKVDEKGTEAAAVTAIAGPTSLPPGVYADKPFLLAIRERYSGAILFLGTIGDPSLQDSPPADTPPSGCA